MGVPPLEDDMTTINDMVREALGRRNASREALCARIAEVLAEVPVGAEAFDHSMSVNKGRG
jgi:hypothetical protein